MWSENFKVQFKEKIEKLSHERARAENSSEGGEEDKPGNAAGVGLPFLAFRVEIVHKAGGKKITSLFLPLPQL